MDAVLGIDWRICFLTTVAVTMFLTILFIVGLRWQILSLLTLAALALAASNFPRIGTEYMPPLDEGSILDMPVTVPRVSVTQAADDLKARDALLRRFPEVEMIVGKAGRADTPTDPSPLDMVESIITLRPKEYWPKRKLEYKDARKQTAVVLSALQQRGLIEPIEEESERRAILDPATMNALARMDQALRELVLQRYSEFEADLGPRLLREFTAELVGRWQKADRLLEPVSEADIDRLAAELLTAGFGRLYDAYLGLMSVLGAERPTLFTQMLDFTEKRRDKHWREQVRQLDYEIFDQAVGAFDWYAIEELHKAADEKDLWAEASSPLPPGEGTGALQHEQLQSLRAELDAAWSPHLFLWRKSKDDLLKEMDTVVHMPGWSNIWTQPIINRIDMLATGVRTMIGVKVFGNNLDKIQTVSEQVANVVQQVAGAVNVVPDQIRGKGYLEININRQQAARYGVSVGDIQDVIETALGGKAITMTVEGRERFPVRIRYARAFREDEEDVKNLLVNAATAPMVQVPLGMVADVKIVEGPAMIKSENGMLVSYVQLGVRERDIVGFVEEAERAVDQKIKLPQGMYLQWTGQFENQVRARKTMQVVFPAVVLVIFVILYLTYHDFVDAVLMMMAVPEALVGGVFFLWLCNYHFSVAVQVGFIACFGMATETGIIMLVYLREAIEKRGGLLIADEVVDIFIPVRFYWVRRRRWLKLHP